MVQLAGAEHLARLAANSPYEVVTEEGLKMYGLTRAARLEIPLTDPTRLRETADILRGLANSLDQVSRDTSIGPYNALLRALLDIRAANQKIKGPTKSGKPL
jgi:hypothetical protein